MGICELVSSQVTIQLAIKYATRLHLLQLAERLNELSRQRILNTYSDNFDESADDDVGLVSVCNQNR